MAIPIAPRCSLYSMRFFVVASSYFVALSASVGPGLPLVVNTWGGAFTAATDAAFAALSEQGASALDAVQVGCSTCEKNQCDGTVGFGGSPDENCETTLDAMIMDGTTMRSGAVAGLRRIKDAVAVARHVLEHTTHTLIVGDQATEYAVAAGFTPSNLSTDDSTEQCAKWRAANCQPNYRVNVKPDPKTSCGPYKDEFRSSEGSSGIRQNHVSGFQSSHDTISMIAIDKFGIMAAATSTNGASFKVPGRVGDGPITGSGSYVDGDIGGCGATGDGDIMMRFLPCYQAVENLRQGMSPTAAAEDAVKRMLRKYPQTASGLVVMNHRGEHGGAASGWTFTYSVRGGTMNATEVLTVKPISVAKSARYAACSARDERAGWYSHYLVGWRSVLPQKWIASAWSRSGS